MTRLHMLPWELAELASLLQLYIDVYSPTGSEPQALLKEINGHVSGSLEGQYSEKNPRGAGRHSRITPDQKKNVADLHSGGKSVRRIAGETGLSVGTVHKLIRERADNSIKENPQRNLSVKERYRNGD